MSLRRLNNNLSASNNLIDNLSTNITSLERYERPSSHTDINHRWEIVSRDKENWAAMWRSMCAIACGFDSEKDERGKFKKDIIRFIEVMLMNCTRLPCEVCRKHSTEYFENQLKKFQTGKIEYRYRRIEKNGEEDFINITCLNMVVELRIDVEKRQHRPRLTQLNDIIEEFYVNKEECNSCKVSINF